jgi:hypothetical protein
MKYKIFLCLFILFFCKEIRSSLQTISTPGTYSAGFDFNIEDFISDGIVIHITTSNVVIDFSNSRVSQAVGNQTLLNGIVIDENLENIQIKNGRIEQLTGMGIKIGDGCKNISIENMHITGCNAGGILFDGIISGTGITQTVISQCVITSCTGSNGGEAFGLKAVNALNMLVSNCVFNSNDALSTSSGCGARIENSQFLQIINSSAKSNGGDSFGAGFCLLNSKDIVIRECSAIHNKAISSAVGSLVAGFYLLGNNNAVLNDCESIENVNEGREAAGFYAQGGSAEIFEECYAEVNQGATQASGFLFSGETFSAIINCRILMNNTTTSGTGYGIFFSGTTNDRCYASENRVIGNSGVAGGIGIRDQRVPSTSLFLKNYAFDNGTNFLISYPLTIVLPTITGSLSNAVTALPSLVSGDLDNIDVLP